MQGHLRGRRCLRPCWKHFTAEGIDDGVDVGLYCTAVLSMVCHWLPIVDAIHTIHNDPDGTETR